MHLPLFRDKLNDEDSSLVKLEMLVLPEYLQYLIPHSNIYCKGRCVIAVSLWLLGYSVTSTILGVVE